MICFVSCSLFGNAILVLYYNSMSLSQAYENVALNKTAYQTNQYKKGNDSFDASNAVDGLKSNLHWSGGQCAVSALEKETATWWVDLGTIHRIHHITLYYRTENIDWDYRNNATSSFLGFSLYVSNTTNRLQGILCFKDYYFNRSTIPAVFNTTCPVQGQYVIYYNERLKGVSYPSDYNKYAENDLCEVEVYGCQIQRSHFANCALSNTMTCECPECKPGFHGHQCEAKCDIGNYGYNCNETCGHCMDPKQCSTVSGTCPTGCKGRYVGPLCKEECDISHFGYNCNETCGHCKDPTHCSPVYGTCLTGCRTGYFGRLCKENDNLNSRMIEFYSLIGAIGLSIIIIIILSTYIIIKRINHNNHRTGHDQLRHTPDIPVANHEGAAFGEYMCVEFGERNADNPYDTIQERLNIFRMSCK